MDEDEEMESGTVQLSNRETIQSVIFLSCCGCGKGPIMQFNPIVIEVDLGCDNITYEEGGVQVS